ncbi:MAG: head-tail connector protein [Alphaproteobacteria bacterium]|nr:head-tail connector protein [Alphaproteobacteria bacterium]
MDSSEIVLEFIKRQEIMSAERSGLERQWRQISEYILPQRGDFKEEYQQPLPYSEKVFDGTAGLAAYNLASGLWSMMTNSATEWFNLQCHNHEMNDQPIIRLWLDHATNIMRQGFAAQGGKFYSRILDLYLDLVCFGTAIFYVEQNSKRSGIHYSCRHLSECFIAENYCGEVDTIIRKFSLTARQAYQLWNERCHYKIIKALDRYPEQKFNFLHVVVPCDEMPKDLLDHKDKKFSSFYIDIGHKNILSVGSYFEFPYMVPRWSTRPGHVYGDSPAMLAMADVKMLNTMCKTTITSAQKMVDPPLLAVDEMAVRGIRTTPGGIIYGGLNANGQRLYEPLSTQGNIGLGFEIEEQRRQAIKEIFFSSLMQMVQQPNLTATEILIKQEEKLRLMAPHLGRLQTEFLDPLIDRQFALMARSGCFPPLPEEMGPNPIMKIDYVSPLARVQKNAEGMAILRSVEALLPMANYDPSVLSIVDPYAYGRSIVDAFGAPQKILRMNL